MLSFQSGDMPAIDTLEALINLRNRKQELIKFEMGLEIARQNINNFLYLDGVIPIELDSLVVPEALEYRAMGKGGGTIKSQP